MISPAIIASPVVTRVSQATRRFRVLGDNGIQNGIRNLIGDLVRVAFGDRLGGKQKIRHSHG